MRNLEKSQEVLLDNEINILCKERRNLSLTFFIDKLGKLKLWIDENDSTSP